MRKISVLSLIVLSFSLLGCGGTVDESVNQPTVMLSVNINESSIVVSPDNVTNGKLTLNITNTSADIRQIKIEGLDVNVMSLPIAATNGTQQMILNVFTQKGKLIISSTNAKGEKRLETNITIK